MVDFLKVVTRNPKRGLTEIYPKFVVKRSKDLMIRGGDFYAVWIDHLGIWSTDEQDAIELIDRELEKQYEAYINKHPDETVIASYLWDSTSGSIDAWHKYCWKQMRDNYHPLDEKLIFSNDDIRKEDYASKRLNYPLEQGSIEAYDELISTLYTPEERHKIEWAIGAIVTGASKHIQKFMVLYGSAGTGKSTIINIVQKLFDGYYSVFDAKALGSNGNAFALEAFKDNPLVAIQHDGDLSRIEDNTRLNSLVSHEQMTINEKFKAQYTNRFKAFLLLGTNKPVKITDAKSGLIRRLIDVTPSGNKLPVSKYNKLVKQIDFELGAIAYHCKEVYLANPSKYDSYIPTMMMGATNDFYNFVEEQYFKFKQDDQVTLKGAWASYKEYCEDANVPFPYNQRAFREELRNYFHEFHERVIAEDGSILRNLYKGFIVDKFTRTEEEEYKLEQVKEEVNLIKFEDATDKNIFNEMCKDYLAQYASKDGIPMKAWDNVKTKLSDIDTSKLHYVMVPLNHIVIDFDIPDENGNKDFQRNLEAASKFPPTYAELSKSGAGIHLHYIYSGDPEKLSRVFDEYIEVKVFTGKSTLRRALSKCNDLPIATISSGLPLKGDKKMVDSDTIKNEKHLRIMIMKCLNKEFQPHRTKPSIDFIAKLLDDAYNSDLKYDVTNLRNKVLTFAANSTHNSEYCVKAVTRMKFKSEEPSENIINENAPIVFYDVEVFPNLFLVNWKVQGKDKKVVRMINPKPSEIEELLSYKLIGFNCRRYDNHMLYARLMGYSCEEIYNLSQRIIVDNDRNAFFREAYNISYTDVYDFAAKKQSLKKWEIELGLHHQELGLPWDQPVPEELWEKVAKYCDNDVIATEATFDHLSADFMGRQILAELAGGTVNDTTNSLTTRIILGNDKNPQSKYEYRDMGEVSHEDYIPEGFDEYTRFNKKGQPVFPGYEYVNGVSTYRGEVIGEGGRVYAEPGMYGNVPVLDIASQHPHSAIAENIFGPYTKNFADIVNGRIAVKHEDWEHINTLLDGRLTPAIEKIQAGIITSADLAYALKIAINSVYGLTSAKFMNPLRDPRNIDNIVAKRGALFMENLRHEVQKRGFTVVHIKTDSIKIADATNEIIDFVMKYGKMYSYTFEHEATYDRMCLVNNAVYIAKYKDAEECKSMYGYIPADNAKHGGKWTATGTQFKVPYVFKTLFSKEPYEFKDFCETKSVQGADIYLDMNESKPDMTAEEKELDKYEKLLKKEDFRKYSRSDLENNINRLTDIINENHVYKFVGKVGQFTPVKSGAGGGVLVAKRGDKYGAVTGTIGYRWLESEYILENNMEDQIDKRFYQSMVDDAAEAISFYGDLEWFISDDPYIGPRFIDGKPIYVGEN